MNFRDVLNVLGQYPGEPPLGAECSGIVTRVGDRVTAFAPGDHVLAVAADTFADYVTVDQELVVPIPSKLDLQLAATVPIAYLTASVALEEIGKLKAGDRVLIHSATGGVGLAAIHLSRCIGAEIFATASIAKHAVLREMGIRHIYDSRSVGFAQEILDATSNQGVDVVLNTLGSEFIEENVRALANNGKYLDITKATHAEEHLAIVSRNDLHYQAIDLAQSLKDQREMIAQKLPPLLKRVASGQLKPLPTQCFDLSDAKEAFRFMRSSRHIGKLLLRPAAGQKRASIR